MLRLILFTGIPIKPTESIPVTKQTIEIFSQMSTMVVTEGVVPTHINLTTKMTMDGITTLKGTNTTEKLLTDSAGPSIYLPGFLPEQPSEVSYRTTNPPVLLRPISPTASKVLAVTLKETSDSITPSFSTSLPPSTLVVPSFPAFPLITTASTVPLEYGTSLAMLATLPLGPEFIKIPTSILTTKSLATRQFQTSEAATQSLLTEKTSYSSPLLFTGSPLTKTFPVTSKSRSTETHPLIYPFSLSELTTSDSPLFTSRFTTYATSPHHITTTSDIVTVQPTSQISTGMFMPTSASLKALLSPSEHIVPITTKHISVIEDRIRTLSSTIEQTTTSIWSSMSPKETYMMPTLEPPPITTQRPKATGEVTIVSKSFHIGPSTLSLPGIPQTSKTLSKHTLHTDLSPVSAVHGSSAEFTKTRVLPSSTSTLPITVSYDTPQTTSKATVHMFDVHTELKTASVIKSLDTFPTTTEFPGSLSALTSPSTLLTVLSTRSSVPHTSASETQRKSSPAFPTISVMFAVKPADTHIQMPIVPLGMQTTLRSPSSHLASFPPVIPLLTSSTSISAKDTAPEISDMTIQPLGTRGSSLVSLSSLSSGLDTKSAEVAVVFSNTTSALPDITEKYSSSSPAQVSDSSASTILPSQSAQVTGLSSISFEHYATATSAPVLATSQIPIYAPSFPLFTPKPSTEAFRTTDIKTDKITLSDWAKQNVTSIGKTAYALQSNQTSEVKEFVTETKYVIPEEHSLLPLTMSPIQMIPSVNESSTASVKPVSFSEAMDITLSDWSRVPPPKSIRPHYNVTEPEQVKITSLQNVTITDSPFSTAEHVGIQTETEIMTTESLEHASFGTMIHTLVSVTSPECTVGTLLPIHFFIRKFISKMLFYNVIVLDYATEFSTCCLLFN